MNKNVIIGEHQFKKDPLKTLIFLPILLVPIGFLVWMNVILKFPPGSVFVTILLIAFVGWLFYTLTRYNLFIDDTGISTKNNFGVITRADWGQVVAIEYGYVYKGKNSGNYFTFLLTDKDNAAFTYNWEVHGGDYKKDDKRKIAQLFFDKLGMQKLTPNVLKLMN